MRTQVEIDSPGGTITLQLDGRKLVAVSHRVDFARLLADCPLIPVRTEPKPPEHKEVMRFFGATPMDFAGYDELKAAYLREHQEAETARCRPCKIGSIIRKYIKLVAAAMAAKRLTDGL